MKRFFLFLGMALLSVSAFAKDIKTFVVTPTPQMHCAGCENKIKNGLKFEKGIKDIQTSVPNQTVTIKYDAEKTNTDELIKAFGKIGYKVSVVTEKKDNKVDAQSGATSLNTDK